MKTSHPPFRAPAIRNSFLALIGMLAITACRKDRPDEPEVVVPNIGVGGVFIPNEGNFQAGNATVSYYDIATGIATEDLYAPANGTSLGDVCQSMRLFNGKAYVVVNNSGKVVVVDPATFVTTATITGFASPRFLLPVGNHKAYVTDLYANTIAVVDLASNSITGHIPCPGWTEELALVDGKAFVTNKSHNYVYVINTATDVLEDSIAVSRGSNSICLDTHGKLWVACSGGSGTQPALYRIDPQSNTIEADFPFPTTSDSPWRLSMNSDNDTLYYLNGDVFRMPITSTTLPAGAFVPAAGRNFYGLGVEPQTGVLYVSDASDYVQRGTVYRYRSDGSVANTFLAGTIPGGFVFN
ncbi:MAG: YncE family protein [Flavobacteriales bacterium]|nr:YncE family protein [Flavobacteriales bacterium]